ncbi:MAG: GntR family transcriptional regulator [Oscillospiraceae bacterium]|nr:GntR family transcriptional regulator [Oscillospiraceae bacterium]
MKIIIRSQSELPIYAQIAEQIREQILTGTIPEGAVLPSIRALAREIGVSVITTTRAYGDLEKEGFIAAVQGTGTVVLSRDNELLREQYLKRVEDSLMDAISTARTAGLDKKELFDVLEALWASEEEV